MQEVPIQLSQSVCDTMDITLCVDRGFLLSPARGRCRGVRRPSWIDHSQWCRFVVARLVLLIITPHVPAPAGTKVITVGDGCAAIRMVSWRTVRSRVGGHSQQFFKRGAPGEGESITVRRSGLVPPPSKPGAVLVRSLACLARRGPIKSPNDAQPERLRRRSSPRQMSRSPTSSSRSKASLALAASGAAWPSGSPSLAPRPTLDRASGSTCHFAHAPV